jgi:hypothetical protein
MTWLTWINVLTAFFSFVEWLTDLLAEIEKIENGKLGIMPADPVLAIHDVFAAARAELWWWQRGKRRVLDAAQRVALGRANELASLAVKGSVVAPVMTVAEFDAVVNAG